MTNNSLKIGDSVRFLRQILSHDDDDDDEWNWVLDSKMIYSRDCRAITSDCSPLAAFVFSVASNRSRDEAGLPLCRENKWKGAVESHFCSLSWKTQALLQCGITARDVWVSERMTYFCSPLWAAGESCELHC